VVEQTAQVRLPAWLADWLAATALPAAPASDEACMRLAIWLACENVARNSGGPFGAVVRSDSTGEIVSVGVNLVPSTGNPVLHAETVALSLAAASGRSFAGLTLFTSCEPCIMCLGALHWSGIHRIVSAALKADAEAVGFSEGAGTRELRDGGAGRGVQRWAAAGRGGGRSAGLCSERASDLRSGELT